MKIRVRVLCSAILSFITIALPSAPEHAVLQFQARGALVRISSISGERDRDSIPPTEAFVSALMDSTDRNAASPLPDRDEGLLEIYCLEKSTGAELRFPAKLSHLRDYLRQHPSEYRTGTLDERAVKLARDMSVDLRVHMKKASAGSAK